MPNEFDPLATVRVIPLGGIGEIGKNITVFELNDELIILDCGLTFPREEGHFGVDIVLPDFSYLKENEHRIRALVLTHAHEDHIGAVPYLLRELAVPQVLGTRFTLALVKSKVDEVGLLSATEWVEIVPENDPVLIGSFELEFVRVAHSIPDCVAVALHTPAGTIFHTGDLKLDPSPLDGIATDLGHIAEIGGDGVALYMADSTQADVPGHTRSERTLSGPLRDVFSQASGRVIATCFSSQIHRVQQFLDIALEEERSVCVLGRSLNRNINIARNLGYLNADRVDFVRPNQLSELADENVLILCTGSQGEPLAALSRIANHAHASVRPQPSDTFIFSSRTIPGNDTRVHRIQNQLAKVGARVISTEHAHVHVSGHASSAELQTLLQLVRPSYFLPVHGEWRHLRAHAELAELVGVPEQNTLLVENGSVIELHQGEATLTKEFVTVGQQLVDRSSNDEIIDDVLSDRQKASSDGVVVIVGSVDEGLDVILRGFTDENGDLNGALQETAEALLLELGNETSAADVVHRIEIAVAELIKKRTRRAPLIVAAICS